MAENAGGGSTGDLACGCQIIAIVLVILGSLGVLYLIVRFVKWAWTVE